MFLCDGVVVVAREGMSRMKTSHLLYRSKTAIAARYVQSTGRPCPMVHAARRSKALWWVLASAKRGGRRKGGPTEENNNNIIINGRASAMTFSEKPQTRANLQALRHCQAACQGVVDGCTCCVCVVCVACV